MHYQVYPHTAHSKVQCSIKCTHTQPSVQYSAVSSVPTHSPQYSTVQYQVYPQTAHSKVQYSIKCTHTDDSTVQCSMQYIRTAHSAVQCSIKCSNRQPTHTWNVHNTPCPVLDTLDMSHCTTLRYTILHYTLHYTTLHYT